MRSVVLNSWNTREDNRDTNILERIKKCGVHLNLWTRTCFGNVQPKLRKAQAQLKSLQESNPSLYFQDKHREARKVVQNWLEKYELMWCQRSRVSWLKDGDHNSSFFHQKSSSRR